MEKIKYFETIKCEDFEVFNLEYHNKRVANTIGLNINLQEYIYPISHELLRCKVIYDKNGIIDVTYFPYKKREITSFKIVNCDEIIIIKEGVVTDTSIANIAIFYQGNWITSKQCLLKGTVRNRLLEEKRLIEKDINLPMLQSASKIALMNAMIDFDILEGYLLKL